MQAKLRFVIPLLIAALLLSTVGTLTVTAQGGDYVKTFDLKLPIKDGDYAGVDPSGTKIVYWHPHTGDRDKAIKAAADKFNKENPWKITVEPIYKGNYPDVYNSMLAALQTKQLPALTVAYQNQAAQYQNVNSLVDLNVFFNDKTLGFSKSALEDFYQGYLDSDVNPQFNNQRLGMALYRSMESIYYNVDALKALGYDAPPENWDQFKGNGLQVCQVRLRQDGLRGARRCFVCRGGCVRAGWRHLRLQDQQVHLRQPRSAGRAPGDARPDPAGLRPDQG